MHALVTRLRAVTDRCCDAMTGSLIVSVLLLLTTSSRLDARRVNVCEEDLQGELLSQFSDVASLTVLSSAVFDGRPTHADDDSDDEDVVRFRVGTFYKGAGEMFPEGLEDQSSSPVHIAVRLSSVRCATSLRRRRRRFLVFLNESHAADSLGDDRAVFSSTAPPVRFTRRFVKVVKKHSCPNCGMFFLTQATPYVIIVIIIARRGAMV